MNGSNVTSTWADAGHFCQTDPDFLSNNVSNSICHLVALENEMEENALTYWMKGK